jgi:hypothetical protein
LWGLRFGFGLHLGVGLLHGGLKTSTILFDANQRSPLADFSPKRRETGAVEPFSAFASLVSEITATEAHLAPSVPEFVWKGGRYVAAIRRDAIVKLLEEKSCRVMTQRKFPGLLIG